MEILKRAILSGTHFVSRLFIRFCFFLSLGYLTATRRIQKNALPSAFFVTLALTGCGGVPEEVTAPPNTNPPTTVEPCSSLICTANTPELLTWWQNNAEPNTHTPVQDNNVRQSPYYQIKVATAAKPASRYDAFTYLSIPRGGRKKWGYSSDDGAEYASEAGLTMSWSTFLYSADTLVDITLPNSIINSTDEVSLRPAHLNLQKQKIDDHTIRITVPYSSAGLRFSVEFNSEQLTTYQSAQGQLNTAGGTEVHTAPKNALMIFAEPKPDANNQTQLIPNTAFGTVYYPKEGDISNLDTINTEVIYFKPGTYYMPWNYRASLSSTVKWVYLAPGTYIKGAFYIPGEQAEFKITGFGILSGEKYVYEADMNNGFKHKDVASNNCNGSCVKLLQFNAGNTDQHLTLHGVTLSEPPFNTFVAYGNVDRFHLDASHYKQVGGWYWQTDGLELYAGSTLNHGFFHANDDVIKLYHSDVKIADVVIWKGENGPVVQWGWSPRTINNVQLDGMDVIHNFMHWQGAHNICVLNSARSYLDIGSTFTADTTTTISNFVLQNIHIEGKNMCVFRFFALSNWQNIQIKNLAVDAWNGLDTNTFQAFSNANHVGVTIGNQTLNKQGLALENFTVAGVRISKAAHNWESFQAGRLNFESGLWENWEAW